MPTYSYLHWFHHLVRSSNGDLPIAKRQLGCRKHGKSHVGLIAFTARTNFAVAQAQEKLASRPALFLTDCYQLVVFKMDTYFGYLSFAFIELR